LLREEIAPWPFSVGTRPFRCIEHTSPRRIPRAWQRNRNRPSRSGEAVQRGEVGAPDEADALEEAAAEFKVPATKLMAVRRRPQLRVRHVRARLPMRWAAPATRPTLRSRKGGAVAPETKFAKLAARGGKFTAIPAATEERESAWTLQPRQ
jgi:hypothetical protein